MSSNLEDIQASAVRYYGMQLGVVTDVADPLGLHRVCVEIPGVTDKSDWLYPMLAGGGSAQRGGHIVPDEGATCAVWFHQGDTENGQGVYQPVAWSSGDEGSEVPYDAKNAGSDAHLIQTLRIGRIILSVDERPGQESFKLYDALGAFEFQVDLVRKIVQLAGLTGLRLKADGQVEIDGVEVKINGRRVITTSSPL